MILRKGVHAQEGFVLPTAIALIFIVLMISFALIQSVDVQTHQTGREVGGEAAFNLAETVLDAEADQLRTAWPSSSPGWAVCTQSSAPAPGCPGTALNANMSAAYGGISMTGATWKAQIVDDVGSGGASYYDDTMAATAPSWDSNADNTLWIRAQATVNGQTKAVTGQVLRQVQTISLPHNTVTAGSVFTSNNGNKVIIQSQDPASGLTGPVALRCGDSTTVPVYQSSCAGWDPTHGQLNPAGNFQPGYVDPGTGSQTLNAATLAQIKATAIANGTYYPAGTCPPGGQAGIVYVENADCTYQHVTFNSLAAPGAMVFASGSLFFNGNVNFYGIIYMANGQGATPTSLPCVSPSPSTPVFTVHGGGTLDGSVFVDKCGAVDAGDSAYNIQFDPNAFGGLRAYATPALAKNTFRQLAG